MSVKQEIETKLVKSFNLDYFEVVNESRFHNVPEDSETHFKVVPCLQDHVELFQS